MVMRWEGLLQTPWLLKDVCFSLPSTKSMIQFVQLPWLRSTFVNQQNTTKLLSLLSRSWCLASAVVSCLKCFTRPSHILLWGFGNYLAIWGVSFCKWDGWSLTKMQYFTLNVTSAVYSQRKMWCLKLGPRWDLGKLLEENSFRCEVIAKWDVCWGETSVTVL